MDVLQRVTQNQWFIYLRKGKKKTNMELLEKILTKDNLNKAYKKVYQNKGTSGVDGITVYEIKEYIQNNLHKAIRVDEIAAGLYHSPHYIGNVFASINGVTIKEYALQCKMQKALNLLGIKGLSVAETARKLGYDSAHYFSKCFKKRMGFSPREYKKSVVK